MCFVLHNNYFISLISAFNYILSSFYNKLWFIQSLVVPKLSTIGQDAYQLCCTSAMVREPIY